MKKVILFFLTLFVASSVWAEDETFVSDGVTYRLLTDSGGNWNFKVSVNSVSSDIQGRLILPQTLEYKGYTFIVTSIGSASFKYCTDITSVIIPEGVTLIESEAFYGCTSLTSLIIPDGVTEIGEEAFYGCTNLTSVSIPESVNWIRSSAFTNCSSLTSITIPNGVTSIGTAADGMLGYDGTFQRCTSLTSVIIPSSVTYIGRNSFFDCSSLSSIQIPNSVTEIGHAAFTGTGLTSLTLNGVTTIAEGAFSYCKSITSITIENVPEIKYHTFLDCTNLTSVTINGATSFGEEVFTGCTKLKDVTCLSTTPPEAYANTFENYNGYLHVLCESKDDYDFANCWGSFKHVECIGSETVELTKDEVKVEPERSEAVFTMPQNESANSYTLTIQNNGVTFCTLTFNAQGQLSNIDFSTTKSYELKASVSAYQFTVTGLSEATDYGYSFKALASNKSVLKEYTGSFTTKNGDGTGGSSQGGAEVGGGSGQGGEGGEQGGEGGNQTAINGVSNATTVAIVGNQILVNGEAPAFVVTVSGKKIANQNLKSGVYFVVADGETVGVSVR